MASEAARKVLTEVRFNAAKKSLEQYNSMPILMIGVTCTDDPESLIFALDSNLTEKDLLILVESCAETLRSKLSETSITDSNPNK